MATHTNVDETTLNSLSTTRNNNRATFQKVFDSWICKLKQLLGDLKNAVARTRTTDDPRLLKPVINGVIVYYQKYYQLKAIYSVEDGWAVLNPSWKSSLEIAYQWIGGWKPSMAFHLIYSKPDLELSWIIKERLNELHEEILCQENVIGKKMGKWQEKASHPSMVVFSHKFIKYSGSNNQALSYYIADGVETFLEVKEEVLKGIMAAADDLRLRTLKAIIDILTPMQGVGFLISAIEMYTSFYYWGKEIDEEVDHVNG